MMSSESSRYMDERSNYGSEQQAENCFAEDHHSKEDQLLLVTKGKYIVSFMYTMGPIHFGPM